MLTGRDIVCLSTQDWNGLWTRKQRFMQMFARQGNRVLYVETPVHLLGLDVLPHDPARPFRFLRGPRLVESRLYVGTLPLLLPFFQMSHSVNMLNHVIIRAVLRQWIRKLGFRNLVLWIYTPFSAPVLDGIAHSAAIYECVDELRAAKGFVRSKVIAEMEDTLLDRVDLTIVTQENLIPLRKARCKRTFCVPNGADTEQFRQALADHASIPAEIDKIARPRLGFVGHIHYWIDLKLIRFLAEHRPNWSFLLIGPISPLSEIREIRHLNNIHLLGKRPPQEIPLLLQHMDVCLNPYIKAPISDHASPLKLYEYLAAGKPVVSTEMAEALKFRQDVQVARTYEEFLMRCQEVLNSLPEHRSVVDRRRSTADQFSWTRRFQDTNALIERALCTSGLVRK